jgi:hypothetical protein
VFGPRRGTLAGVTRRTSTLRAWSGGFPAVLAAVAILPACGRSQRDSLQEDRPGTQTGWTYGSPTWSVISSAASDGDRIYVIVGERAEAKPNPLGEDFATPAAAVPYAIHRVAVAALDRSGNELWVHDLCPGRPGPPVGPSVARDGSIVAACSETIYRVSPDGTDEQSAPLPVARGNLALGDDLSVVLLAPYFSTGRTDSGHEFQTAAALFYLNADLSLRWSKAVGFTTGDDLPQLTRLSPMAGPLLDDQGNVYAPCDTCDTDADRAPTSGRRAFFSRFGAETGDFTALVELDPGPTTFGMSAGVAAREWDFIANGSIYSLREDGSSRRLPVAGEAFLIAEQGMVFLAPSASGTRVQVGEKLIEYAATSALALPGGPRTLGNGFVLLSDGRAIDDMGKVVLEIDDLDPAADALVLDGMLVTRTKDQRLRATVTELEPAADAPWPSLAGDARATRVAR